MWLLFVPWKITETAVKEKRTGPWLAAQPLCLQYTLCLIGWFFLPPAFHSRYRLCLQCELRPWSWWLGLSLDPQELLSWNLTVSVPSLQGINILWWKLSQEGRPDPDALWQVPWKGRTCPVRLSCFATSTPACPRWGALGLTADAGQRRRAQAVISLYAVSRFSIIRGFWTAWDKCYKQWNYFS